MLKPAELRELLAMSRPLLQEARARRWLRRYAPSCQFEYRVTIKGPLANLFLGERVIVQSGVLLHLGGFEWCENTGRLEIGDDSILSPNCVVYATGPGGIKIGRRFDCGAGVGIFASRTDYANPGRGHVFAPVVIGDDVVVFANCVISPGVTIGDGAVVAAGSVVTDDVPPGALVGGAPAAVVRADVRSARTFQSEAP